MRNERRPERAAGLLGPSRDHGWFEFSPLPARPPVRWPEDATVAVSIVLDVRAVEWESPGQVPVPPPGGRGVAPYPDFPRMSHREFGHRVGIFRVLDMLDDLDIAPSAAVDVLTVEHYAPLLAHLGPAVSEFVAGGLSASRPITSAMTADEERHYIETTLQRLDDRLGTRPTGWLGAEHAESARTPALLADAGLGYVADWGNDEQPYPMTGAGGDLWSFPLSWELCDLRAMHERGVSAADYGRSITEAFDILSRDGATSGRVLALHMHPWVSGQAFRAEEVERALARLRASDAAWWASPGEIVAWCRDHQAAM